MQARYIWHRGQGTQFAKQACRGPDKTREREREQAILSPGHTRFACESLLVTIHEVRHE